MATHFHRLLCSAAVMVFLFSSVSCAESGETAACKEGTCGKADRVDLIVCSGGCREYYPQIRYFIRDYEARFPMLKIAEDPANLTPALKFYDAEGEVMERLEVGGMLVSEILEELSFKGVFPAAA